MESAAFGKMSSSASLTDLRPSDILGCSYSPSNSSVPLQPPEFTFESDHEALKNNSDYLALLRTFAILQAQKIQAVKDVDTLLEARDAAMKDPIALVEKLQRGEKLDLPGRQQVAEMPDIEWEKYQIAASQVKKPETRNKGGAFGTASATVTSTSSPVDQGSMESLEGLGCKVEKSAKGQFLVRGRIFDDRKPKTFNQPWTPEEQQRLQELLEQFPSEDVEMERWKKVASALGNRTAIQVQSRTQKYFLKLQKAGLPIPGRQGKARYRFSGKTAANSRTTSHVHKRHGNSLISQRNSTFFPNLSPAVKMSEDGDDDDDEFGGEHSQSIFSNSGRSSSEGNAAPGILNDLYYVEEEDVSDEEGVMQWMLHTKAYEELMWLKRIRREKELEQQLDKPWVHRGFSCDGCGKEPIVGGRFQCTDCKEVDTVDFCCDCAPKGIEKGSHTKDHVLKPVRRKYQKVLIDQEYVSAASNNYLDPNFIK